MKQIGLSCDSKLSRKTRLFAIAVLLGIVTPTSELVAQVPNDQEVANICAAVSSQSMEITPNHFWEAFQYQNLIGVLAGINKNDSETVWAQKMGGWLSANMDLLLCKQSNFVLANGNILKLAVARQSDPFLSDVTERWQVDLNQVDKIDGKTVLDYIKDKEVAAGSNKSLARTYTQLYERFVRAGAKFARDLK